MSVNLIEKIVTAIREEPDPSVQFSMLLSKLLGPLVAQLTDEEWESIGVTAIAPCPTPDCNCETIRAPVFVALDALRDDYTSKFSVGYP